MTKASIVVKPVVGYALALLVIVAVYCFLNGKYRIYYVDDAWCLSYVRNYIVRGVDLDTLVRPPGHPRSILYFGKAYHFIYGHVLQHIGWTKSNAHAISTVFVFVAAALFGLLLRALRFGWEFVVVSALGMLLFTPFFSAANLSRPDALALVFVLAAMLLFVKEQYLLSGVFCFVATETHIMAGIVGFYILAYVVYARREFLGDRRVLAKRLAAFLVGCVIGCGYYYALHRHTFDPGALYAAVTQHSDMAFPVKSYLVAYFFGWDFYLKLPELIFTVFMVALFFRKGFHREHAFVTLLFFVILGSTLILRRPNGNYMVFAAPAFLLLYVHCFQLLGKLRRYAALTFGYFLIHYAVIYTSHAGFDFERLTRQTSRELVRTELPVIGMMDDWFAAMDREFHPIYPSAPKIQTLALKEAYVIKNDYLSHRTANYRSTMKDLEDKYSLTLLRSFRAYDGAQAQVYYAKRKPPLAP